MRVVFFGSPEYALPALHGLLAVPDIEVVTVVTQPPRPRGRRGTPEPTAVGALAQEAGIRVLAPERIRRDTTEAIAALQPDVGVLAASGHILPVHLLEAFPHGVLNVHASLLPRHRGASPVAAAILAGDAEAGASIMLVVRELDAGPVLARVSTLVEPTDTAGTLTARIAEIGALELLRVLPLWLAGAIEAIAQDERDATYARRLAKSDGLLDWSESNETLWRRVRAYNPWPLATTTHAGSLFSVHEALPLNVNLDAPPGTVLPGPSPQSVHPELGVSKDTPSARVACGTGALALLRVQRAGRRPLDIDEYLRGDPALIGSRLGA